MSRASTPSDDWPDDVEYPLPLYAVGEKVWVENAGITIGGPYWITEIETGGGKLPYYFYKMNDVPDKGKAEEYMPEWWLSPAPKVRDPTFGMSEARKRSKMMRETVVNAQSSGQGTTLTLWTRTDVEESAAGSSAQGQASKREMEENEGAPGSSEQDQMPKTETEVKGPAVGPTERGQKK